MHVDAISGMSERGPTPEKKGVFLIAAASLQNCNEWQAKFVGHNPI
jgi:hypothetical protein